MSGLFASGRAVDIVLAVILVEIILLTARGRRLGTTLVAVVPGVLMLLALRGALTHVGWPWIALALAASFPAHLLDLARRGR